MTFERPSKEKKAQGGSFTLVLETPAVGSSAGVRPRVTNGGGNKGGQPKQGSGGGKRNLGLLDRGRGSHRQRRLNGCGYGHDIDE